MPQSLTAKTVNSFNQGLITEFSELKFPENASLDELNCTLSRDGSRARRLGLEYETGATNSTFTVVETEVFHTGTWYNAGGVTDLNLLVVQHGSTLSFYGTTTPPYSNQEKSYTVNLATYETSTGDSSLAKCQFTSLAGVLVVASSAINTLYVVLNATTETLTVNQIDFRVRDFEWQSDLCDLSDQVPVATVTAKRKYDTLNTGWVGDKGTAALNTYIAAEAAYPPLSHPWYSGKNADGDYRQSKWEQVYSGTSIIANGHFILDFFNKDRSTESGIAGITTEVETSRFSTVAAHAGRIWYAGLGSGQNSGKILYSQIVTTIKDTGSCTVIGECFQQNDPTSEDFSDLLETDGGELIIPDAANIKIIYSYGPFLYVFADNGVWIVGGVDDRFSPTSYFVSKVTNNGILTAESFVSAEGIPFWWSKYGIHTFSFDESSGRPIENNLSLTTIQTFWDLIDTNAKTSVTSYYDPINKKIFWLYPENDETLLNKSRKILILDIPLQAFYPWEIAENADYVMGLYFYDGYGNALVSVDVTDSLLADVTDSTTEVVTVLRAGTLANADTQLAALVYNNGFMSIGLFSSETFLDWGTANYSSYAEAGYDFLGDLNLKKTAPYVTVYCRTTEEGFTGNETDGYEAINPSSLTMKAYWDFKTVPSSSQQAYRIKPFIIVDADDLTNNQQVGTVVTTRLKVRGKGRSMRLRFESEEGKNFVLLGYGVIAGVNTNI